MELAVVGSPTFTLGFKLAGVRRTVEAETPQALDTAVRGVLDDAQIGILVMETPDVRRLDPLVQRDLEKSVRPTLVSIGIEDDTGLRDKLKQALGVDLWK